MRTSSVEDGVSAKAEEEHHHNKDGMNAALRRPVTSSSTKRVQHRVIIVHFAYKTD